MKTIKERFDEKYIVDEETGCWLWTAAKHWVGYGVIGVNGKQVKAHRLSYELHHGPIPKGEGFHGTCVCHKCDVRSCVNPDHLFLGTHQDNMEDQRKKNRVGKAKLTGVQAELLKNCLKRSPGRGWQKFLAEWFSIGHSSVSRLKSGEYRKHLA